MTPERWTTGVSYPDLLMHVPPAVTFAPASAPYSVKPIAHLILYPTGSISTSLQCENTSTAAVVFDHGAVHFPEIPEPSNLFNLAMVASQAATDPKALGVGEQGLQSYIIIGH